MTEGVLDTNVFVHAYTTDEHSEECQRFLAAIVRGDVRGWLDVLVVHELTYVLPRYVNQFTRQTLADFLINVIEWPGVMCDRASLGEALIRWKMAPGASFVDAYLATIAARQGIPVYTKDVRDFAAQGTEVPVPLPS